MVLSYNDDSLVPINRCETSGEIIDIRKRNIITITKDSVRAARRSNVIDDLEFELAKAYNNYGDDPFLPSSPDQMIIAIELESGDSTKILSELLKKINFERQYKIWLR